MSEKPESALGAVTAQTAPGSHTVEGLTIEDVKSLLRYEPDTGRFYWLVTRTGSARAGTLAGGLTSCGHRKIRVQRKQYMEHRLAWFYVYGVWPSGQIDHINQVKTDNRIANLRDVDQRMNSLNITKARADSRTGFKGVRNDRGRFEATINTDGRRRSLGRFDTAEAAHARYMGEKRATGAVK